MWSCHKCGKPVFFAERKQSMGYDWHPDCLKCEECGKILKTGQHAEHKGVPYCHVPCYGALFGPQLFGHGTRVESHKSFGKVENKSYGGVNRTHLETTIKSYNHYHEVHGGSGGIKSREVNGRLILEGVLRLYWGIHSVIQLKEDDDQRLPTSNTIARCRKWSVPAGLDRQTSNISPETSDGDDDVVATDNTKVYREETSHTIISSQCEEEAQVTAEPFEISAHESLTPAETEDSQRNPLTAPVQAVTELEDLEKSYRASPIRHINNTSHEGNSNSKNGLDRKGVGASDETQSVKHTALRRRPGRRFDKSKLRRRCSINGHYYNRETSVFTPPYGSTMSVWTTSLVNTQEVINMLLEKYRVECPANNFSLFIVKDNGERRRVREDEYPLLLRVMQGPDESVAKLFLVEREGENSHEISAAVAQFLRLSEFELQSILRLYCEEEEREVQVINSKYKDLRRRIKKRMQDLKVKL